jgi:Putative Actinobacterial Holin-X, holin superfamily III
MPQPRRDDVVEPFPPPKPERSISALFSDLARETSLLFRQEIALAKAEITEKIVQLGTGVGLLVAGGLIAFCGVLVLLAAAVLGLSNVVPPWAAALIVGGVVLIVGGVLAYVGKRRFAAQNLIPHRTIQSLKDDSAWAKEQVR